MLCSLEIDGAAVRHNYQQFCKVAGRARVAPVLKSNAYGHGLGVVYRALAQDPPAWLCVNYVSEAAQLRAEGFAGRILIVGPAVPEELSVAASLKAEPVVGAPEVLTAWRALTERPRIHVKFDTGMSRQRFRPEDAGAIAAALAPDRDLVAGICTHFANVEDVTQQSHAEMQLARFDGAIAAFRAAGLSPLVHAASSASALIMESSRFDLVRLGISLYGVWPSSLTRVSFLQLNHHMIELQPVLSWRTRVTTVKPVAAGQFIGYGCTFRASRAMRVAVLPVGYFEGYPRIASESPSFVLISGQRCPIVGRICMNMMMVDTTHLPDLPFGAVATLIGADGAETIAAQDLATWSKTIHYEILARLHGDIPRRLVG